MNYTVTKVTGFWEYRVVFRILRVVSDTTPPNSRNLTFYHGLSPTNDYINTIIKFITWLKSGVFFDKFSINCVATLCARVVLKPYAIYRAQLTAFKAVDCTI